MATFEAVSAVNGMFGVGHPHRVKNFPGGTYCQPQVASTGLTEKACKEKGLAYKIGKFPFTASGKAVALRWELPEVQVSQAWVLYATELHDEAVRMVRKAIERKKDCEGAYYLLCRALFSAGGIQSWLLVCVAAAELGPDAVFVLRGNGTDSGVSDQCAGGRRRGLDCPGQLRHPGFL